MSLVEKWIDEVLSGKEKLFHLEFEKSSLYKEISFLKDFNQIDFLITVGDMKIAITEGNTLSLDQYFDFLEEHEKFECIEYACKYGVVSSVRWLYKHYYFWFTDDCFYLASKEFNNDVFKWLLKNTEVINMKKTDIENLLKIKNYEALAIYYSYMKTQ